ncbi:MAG TPA: TolC family protein [Nannocystis sp.]
MLACAHASAPSPERALATWRDIQATANSSLRSLERTTPIGSGRALDAEQAYALALAHNPELAVTEAEVDVAEADIAAARQLDNPTLRLTGLRLDDIRQDRPEVNLGLRAPLPRPGSLRAKIDSARFRAGEAQGAAEAARVQLRATIFRLFARLAWLTADLAEVERAAEIADARRRQLGQRVERALATGVDLALAAAAQSEAQDEVARLRDELARTRDELARIVAPGTSPHFRIDPRDLDVGPLDLDEAALTELALRRRPELRAAQSRVGEAEAAVRLARTEALPWIRWAQVSYHAGPESSPRALGFGVALDLPVLSWNRGEIRSARAVARQRRLEERAQVASVVGEVEAALARARRADARVREIEQNLLPRLELAAQEADAALAAGALDVLKVLDIEARRVAARRLHLAARFERRDALLELEAATGGPLPR